MRTEILGVVSQVNHTNFHSLKVDLTLGLKLWTLCDSFVGGKCREV